MSITDIKREGGTTSQHDGPQKDLKNVLAGYSATDKEASQNLADINYPALPQLGNSFTKSGVGILFNQILDNLSENIKKIRAEVKQKSGQDVLNQIEHINVDNNPSDITEQELKKLIKAYKDLFNANFAANPDNLADSITDTDKQFQHVLQYFILKKRIAYEQNSPQVKASDAPAEMLIHTQQKNASFSRITQAFLEKAQKQIYSSGFKRGKDAIQKMVKHNNQVLLEAAKYDGRFKTKKAILMEQAVQTINTTAVISPKNALENLQAHKEAAEAKLQPILNEYKEGTPERNALEWALEDKRLNAKVTYAPTQENQQALKAHNENYPADYDQQLPTINSQIKKAQPIIRDIIKIESQEAALKPTVFAYEIAEAETEILGQLSELSSDFFDAYQLEKTHTELVRRVELANTPENQQRLKAFETENDKVGSEQFDWSEHSQLNENITHVAKLKNNYATANQHEIEDQPIYQLTSARLHYQGMMAGLKQQLETTANSHPAIIKSIESQMKAAHKQYHDTVKQIHKAAGTGSDKLLNTINIIGRLPELALHKYDLPNAASDSLPAQIDVLRANVNTLLEEREKLLHSLASDPHLVSKVPSFPQDLNKNTLALKKNAKELTQKLNFATALGLSQTHPDIKPFTEAAGILQDAMNRKHFLERHHTLNKLVYLSEISNQSNPLSLGLHQITGGSKKNVAGVKPAQYSPSAAKKLEGTVDTTFLEQVGMFKWIKKHLKAEVEHPNGSKVMEDVSFSRGELKGHIATFCEQHGIEAKIMEDSSGKIRVRWPSYEHRKGFLEYLMKSYQEKRRKELDSEKNDANVEIDTKNQDTQDSISATVPMGLSR